MLDRLALYPQEWTGRSGEEGWSDNLLGEEEGSGLLTELDLLFLTGAAAMASALKQLARMSLVSLWNCTSWSSRSWQSVVMSSVSTFLLQP